MQVPPPPPPRVPPFPSVQEMKGPDAAGMYFWVLLVVFPLWNVVDGTSRPLWPAVAGLALTAALYVWTVRLAFVDATRAATRPLPALAAVTITLAVVYHSNWHALLILTAVAGGVAIYHRWAPLVFTGWCLTVGAISWHSSADGGDVLSLVWGTFTASLVPWIIIRLFDVIALLRETREELAGAAVERERLRFSRDLHDLLGHTLSVMVVKAEAVRRILPADPGAAAEQAADIERIGRQALVEVRTAVSGYRGRGLTAELESARTVLADAGIDATIRTPVTPLTPEADALLGWAVREAVTNVIRHSGARSCEIDLRSGDDAIVLEISDDGGGSRGGGHGHGLKGLGERVTAVRGRLDAGDREHGGFRIRVSVPVGEAE